MSMLERVSSMTEVMILLWFRFSAVSASLRIFSALE